MRWQFKVCLFLLILGWIVFLSLAAYDITNGYSAIWYHFDYWSVSLVVSFVGACFGIFGLIFDIKESGWKLSDFVKIEIVEIDNEENVD